MNSSSLGKGAQHSSLGSLSGANRGSVLIERGQSLINPTGSTSLVGSQVITERGNPLRQSANSQVGNRQKYSYHIQKPAQVKEQAGEYVTKAVRNAQAQQVKASHFQLGYVKPGQSQNNTIEQEQVKQKWNPKSAVVKSNLAKTNWALGNSSPFDGQTQANHDFKNFGATFDSAAKEKRQALVNELRRSNLPTQNFDFPKSTAQESYAQSKSNAENSEAIRKRKQDADEIFARVRPTKPNFSLGGHKLDYNTENKGSMKQPERQTFDKTTLDQQVVTQRKHNYQMSYEKGNQFENDKKATPYKIAQSDLVQKNSIAKKGSSNQHQVQIGHTRQMPDYKSLTALQQDGHSLNQRHGQRNTASFTEVRSKIADLKTDLRSSHFALGKETNVGQASSAVMYQAPPTNALTVNSSEQKATRERIQKSNFSLNDGVSKKPVMTSSQVNNQLRQGQWEKGQVQMQIAVQRPPDSINFGQACQYTSETKSTFVGVNGGASSGGGDPMKLREKFAKPNINLGTSPHKDRLKTMAQSNDEQAVNQMGKQNLSAINKDTNAKSKELSTQMRAASFKMGSILPEHNKFKPVALERNNSGTIGLAQNNQGFKPAIKKETAPIKSQQVSAGNNIAMGRGNFQTVNQAFTGWIQPFASVKN